MLVSVPAEMAAATAARHAACWLATSTRSSQLNSLVGGGLPGVTGSQFSECLR